MTKGTAAMPGASSADDHRTTRFLGSLKDALVAAGREDTVPGAAEPGTVAKAAAPPVASAATPPAVPKAAAGQTEAAGTTAEVVSAGSAARQARGTSKPLEDRHVEADAPPTTRVVKAHAVSAATPEKETSGPARTQLVRGKNKVERGAFERDPVVGWLVVVGGPGIGNYRPVYEGNNTLGRGSGNRIPIDFGDEAISTEEQAYIRYDSSDRSFLFVPNLAKTNVVSLNDKKPTGAVELAHMDVITMGGTQLVFVPFCGEDFDWAALAETNKD